MATPPTITTICTEALKRAGRDDIDPDELYRAKNEWYPEIERDILSRKQWKWEESITINGMQTALTRGVKWKALLDGDDDSASKAEIAYEQSIKKLIRVDNREYVKRTFTKQGGGIPLRR